MPAKNKSVQTRVVDSRLYPQLYGRGGNCLISVELQYRKEIAYNCAPLLLCRRDIQNMKSFDLAYDKKQCATQPSIYIPV